MLKFYKDTSFQKARAPRELNSKEFSKHFEFPHSSLLIRDLLLHVCRIAFEITDSIQKNTICINNPYRS